MSGWLAQVADGNGVLGIYSGSNLPPGMVTDTGKLKLTFKSDATIQLSGFRATYTAGQMPKVVGVGVAADMC